MWRYILLILLMYLLWRLFWFLIPFVRRALMHNEHPMEGPLSQYTPKRKYDLKNIQDADFEELRDDEAEKNKRSS